MCGRVRFCRDRRRNFPRTNRGHPLCLLDNLPVERPEDRVDAQPEPGIEVPEKRINRHDMAILLFMLRFTCFHRDASIIFGVRGEHLICAEGERQNPVRVSRAGGLTDADAHATGVKSRADAETGAAVAMRNPLRHELAVAQTSSLCPADRVRSPPGQRCKCRRGCSNQSAWLSCSQR